MSQIINGIKFNTFEDTWNNSELALEEKKQIDGRVEAVGELIKLRDSGKISKTEYATKVVDETELNIIAEFIKARNEKRISQQELEKLTGITQANISKIENAEASPKLSTMKKLLYPLGYTLAIVPLDDEYRHHA